VTGITGDQLLNGRSRMDSARVGRWIGGIWRQVAIQSKCDPNFDGKGIAIEIKLSNGENLFVKTMIYN